MSAGGREPARRDYDAIVVGSGPNGLAAALVLARAGLRTLLVEAEETPGGGARTEELTLPGFLHDVCSSVHPLAVASPFFRSLRLERYGVEWVHPPAPLVHLLGEREGEAVTLERSVEATARGLGRDGPAYHDLVAPFVERFDELAPMVLGGLRLPRSPWLMARFGLVALRSMRSLARRFRDPAAGALLGGIAAHSLVPLDAPATAAFALVLGCAGHAVGWPIARGGSRAIAQALLARYREAGGELRTGTRVTRLTELPSARAYVLDLTPREVLAVAGDRLSTRYRRRLARFRYGPGVFKMDWALREPIPWRDPAVRRSATVHLAGDLDQLTRAEAAANGVGTAPHPFTLLVQPTLFDPGRAPDSGHIAWAYCHVPNGSASDWSGAMERLIERYAPGFRDVVLARRCTAPRDLERHNPNIVGGDIAGGASDLGQLFFRPMARLDPYATSAREVFLCSSSTPPGGGVHGMCGYWAARSALRRVFGVRDLVEEAGWNRPPAAGV